MSKTFNKIIVILGCVVLLGFSLSLLKKNNKEIVQTTENAQDEVIAEPDFPDTLFSFNKETLIEDCSVTNPQICAVEIAVKCSINSDLEMCKNANLPQFIFIKDAGTDRPTEISYRFTNKKVLANQNAEFYTESSCNGTWFGLCQGTVIYVTSQDSSGKWFVKDIYAIE